MSSDTHHHHHSHGHGHGHTDGAVHRHDHDYVRANEQYFDNLDIDSFNKYPHAESRAIRTAEAVRKVVKLTEETVMMEFACGTGLLSEQLVPHVKSVLGVDISQGMVNAFNKRFADKNIPQANAVKVELKGPNDLEGQKFDVIVCASAYHHFPDVAETTKVLASLLKQNGSLVVVDITGVPFTHGDMDKYKDIVTHHHGFTEDQMRTFYADAGLSSVTYEMVPSFEDDVDVFCVAGTKTA